MTTIEQLTTWCEQFAATYPLDLTDPVVVADRCHVVSPAFMAWCADRGVHADTIVGARFVEAFGVEVVAVAHQATVVTLSGGVEVVVDFTARQFDPGAAVPVVVPVGAWREWWRPLSG